MEDICLGIIGLSQHYLLRWESLNALTTWNSAAYNEKENSDMIYFLHTNEYLLKQEEEKKEQLRVTSTGTPAEDREEEEAKEKKNKKKERTTTK